MSEINEYRHIDGDTLGAAVGSELDKVLAHDSDYELVGKGSSAQAAQAAGASESAEQVDLETLDRGGLNELATKLGIEGAETLPNKGAVKDAIKAAQAAGEEPEATEPEDGETPDAGDDAEGDDASESAEQVDLETLDRGGLNELATKLGIEGAETLPNKGAVKDAIKAAQAAGEEPEATEPEDGETPDAGDDAEGDDASESAEQVDLETLDRGGLNELATKLGIEGAETLPNKGAVKDAIKAAQAAGEEG